MTDQLKELCQIYEAILNLNSHRLIPVDSEKLRRIAELKEQINAEVGIPTTENNSKNYDPSLMNTLNRPMQGEEWNAAEYNRLAGHPEQNLMAR